MKTFVCTSAITQRYAYLTVEQLYSQAFAAAFDAVRGQILKFERLQSYREPGKPWDEAIQAGDVAKAVTFIPELIAENRPDYDDLLQRKVEFIRCRPIVFPASPYLKWEVQAYRQTSRIFEKIYWCLYTQLDDIFENNAQHDFMVFDARMGVIQNYDDDGLLVGGWLIDDATDVRGLLSLFAFIKANCLSLELLDTPKLNYE